MERSDLWELAWMEGFRAGLHEDPDDPERELRIVPAIPAELDDPGAFQFGRLLALGALALGALASALVAVIAVLGLLRAIVWLAGF